MKGDYTSKPLSFPRDIEHPTVTDREAELAPRVVSPDAAETAVGQSRDYFVRRVITLEQGQIGAPPGRVFQPEHRQIVTLQLLFRVVARAHHADVVVFDHVQRTGQHLRFVFQIQVEKKYSVVLHHGVNIAEYRLQFFKLHDV